MKPTLIFAKVLLCLSLPLTLTSQVSVNNTNTVDYYVRNVLLGTGVNVSNIKFNGSAAQALTQKNKVGQFTDPLSHSGLASGMIMGTGNVNLAAQPNNGSGQSMGNSAAMVTDPDLDAISTETLYDKCVIEFDFVPTGDTISFNYVFASEEYEEFVCSQYNDVFGFFLSGPKPGGGNYTSQNVALVPNPSNPGTYTNTAVAINTINQGTAGAYGVNSTCAAQDANWQSYSVFYQANITNTYEYDGRTKSLPVVVPVICNQTYHIKLAIADVGDELYDSGVFLEAGSFTSVPSLIATAQNPGDVIMCNNSLDVQFNQGNNSPPQNEWIFGDGTSSTASNPLHTYPIANTYNVTYIAIDSTTCNIRDTAHLTVNFLPAPDFTTNFSIPTPDPCIYIDSMMVNINFTGSGVDSIVWNMGDQTVYNDSLSVTHYYTNQGTYTIVGTAYDLTCNNQATITQDVNFYVNYATTNAIPPMDMELCASPYNVTFEATGTYPNYFWDFGDGQSSTLDTVTHLYTDTGNYQVVFYAIDSSTCNIKDSAIFNVQINQYANFNASFAIPQPEPCEHLDSLLVTLTYNGTGVDAITWNMGDGIIYTDSLNVTHYYADEGTYNIMGIAHDFTCNFKDTIYQTVDYYLTFSTTTAIPPLDVELCTSPYNVTFEPTAIYPNYYWNFGDGTGSSQDTVTHLYSDTGTYFVTFYAIDSTTCNIKDSATFSVTISEAETFNAAFQIPPIDPCDTTGLEVHVNFTGSGADSLMWNFGDTTYINQSAVTHTYYQQGDYLVTMYAWDLTCNHFDSISQPIQYYYSYTQTQAMAPMDIELCAQPYTVDFNATGNAPNYYWNFDGTNTSNQANPSFTYNATGVYNVLYAQIDSSTCNIGDTVSFEVQINQAEQLSLDFVIPEPNPCEDLAQMKVEIHFTGTGADVLTFNMGDGNIYNNLTDVIHYYTQQGDYTITAFAADTVCFHDTTVTETVNYQINYSEAIAEVPEDIELCGAPYEVELSSASNVTEQKWLIYIAGWNQPFDSSHQAVVNYNFPGPGQYVISYIAIDSNSCNYADTANFNVNITKAPEFSADITFTPPPPCEGDSMIVDLVFSGEAAQIFSWDMGDGSVYYSDSVKHVYYTAGIYPITFTATDTICNKTATITEQAVYYGTINTETIIPNIFTPDGDGKNDLLKFINLNGTSNFKITIWNRWGREVFNSNDPEFMWDGFAPNGEACGSGIYYYELQFVNMCDDKIQITPGFTHLVRSSD